jgi:tectonin-like protein/thiol-activated cytolysin
MRRCKVAKIFRILVLLAAALGTRTAQAQEWQLMDGKARDVGVGADGSVWIIGTNAVGGSHDIWRRNGTGWTNIPGGAERIAVDPTGNAWVINNTHDIYHFDGSKFVLVPGKANDIGVGANGTVWVIGNNPLSGGFDIYRSTNNGAAWALIPGAAVRISVDQSGNAWAINDGGNIYRYNGSTFTQLPGAATDIGIAPDGDAWIIGSDHSSIFRWDGSNWTKKSGGATQIAAGRGGLVWVVNGANEIYKGQDGAAVATSTPASTATTVRRIFPRGQGYEIRLLQALRYGGYGNQIYLNGQMPAVSSLPALDQGFAQLALLAAEINYAGQPQITPDQVVSQIGSYNDQSPRRAVTGFMGMLLAAKMLDRSRDPVTLALRQWATDVYRNQKITAANASLDQYQRWANDPCGYEGKPAGECQTMANLFTTRTPPQDMIALKALGQVMSNQSAEVGSAIAVSAGAVTTAAAAAALSATLGTIVVAGTGTSVASGAVIGEVGTSLFAAFGGEGLGAAGDAAALGAGWAGVAAAPVAAVVMVVVVGTMEGFKVVEAMRVEPMLKQKLGAAMTEPIVIQNALAEPNAGDFFLIAYETAAANHFAVPRNSVDGEVRFYNQAGYNARYKVSYALKGAPQSFSTETLPVGREKAFTIPAAATNVVASGEWSDGINWKPLFTRNLGAPTYIGFTSYGTVFSPQVKDEYPEINSIIAKPNQLTVTQGGGYVARIAVNYTQGGKNVNRVDDSNISAGWNKVFTIPADATNIHLQAWTRTGLVWDPWHQIIDKTYPSPPNECIKVYGTTLDPKYNNECH